MLREVINKHIKPRIVPFQLTTTASGVTLNQGYGDYTAARTGAGAATLTHRDGFNRGGIVLLSQSTAAGYFGTYNSSAVATNSFPVSILDTAGSGAEGSMDGFCFGWDSSDENFVKSQRVAATVQAPRIIWGKITGATGVVAIGTSDFSCTRTADGEYAITFKKAFGKTPIVKVTPVRSSGIRSEFLVSKTSAGCVVNTSNASGTNQDPDSFYIIAIGSDSRSDSAEGKMPLNNSQRKPRIVAGQVLNTGGTWSLRIGGQTGGADFNTIVDVSSGRFSIKLAEPFVREPAIFLTNTTARTQIISFTQATSTLECFISNAAGTGSDVAGVTNIFIIGSDDATQY